MNNFFVLLWDEFRGFIKSKVMLVLWVGLPLITILFYFIQPDTEGFPLSLFTAIIVASIGGLLAAVMLSTTIVSELDAKVYDLYLIRPVKRWYILVSKYIAVLVSLTIASFLSFAIGFLIDSFSNNIPPSAAITGALESLVVSIAAMSISCAAGILIGLLIKSVAVAAILSIYLGQQLSIVAVLPAIFLENVPITSFSIGVGFGVTAIILAIELYVFSKKQF